MPGSVAISGLDALAAADLATGDLLAIVDISDTTQAPTGTTKKITATALLNGGVLAASFTTVTVGSGTVGAPSVAVGEADCGLYRSGANNIGLAVNGAKVLDVATTGLGVTGVLTSSGTATLNALAVTVNATVGGTLGVTGQITGNLTGNVTGNCSGSSGSTTGNAATATALQTARTIWGQSFDGTGNVSGALTGVTTITTSGAINGQTISSAASFTGTMAIGGNTTITATAGSGTPLTVTSAESGTGLVINNTNGSSRGGFVSFQQNGVSAGVIGTAGVVLGTTSSNLAIFAQTGNIIQFYTDGSGTAGMSLSTANVLTVTGGIVGALTGNVTGNVSGTAATVTSATQAAITTLSNLVTVGTITSGVWNAGALTSSGRIITDNTTDATSTTNGSLQTDGGLSVVKKGFFGDKIVISKTAAAGSENMLLDLINPTAGGGDLRVGMRFFINDAADDGAYIECQNDGTQGGLIFGSIAAGAKTGRMQYIVGTGLNILKGGLELSENANTSTFKSNYHGTASLPTFTWTGAEDTGVFLAGGGTGVGIAANGGVEVARFDDNATAGNTRFMIYDVDNGTLERVSVGAADSGGAGFKVLRIPN